MKAYALKKIKTPLVFEERHDLAPDPGEVVVRVKAASLNRRDFWITQGMYPGIELPIVLGSDAAGIVSACGDGVDSKWLDREVIINPGVDWGNDPTTQTDEFTILGLPRDGTFASELTIPACQLYEKPAHLNWHEAAALPLAGVTAYRALFSQGSLQADETVLISGIGGGVATLALQFAVAAGANVWVTSSSAEKIDQAVKLGAEGGFNYKEEKWWKSMFKEASAPNLIIDSAGGSGYAALLNLAAPGGRIVNYGATAGPPENLELFKVFWKQLHLIGSTMGSPADFSAMLEFVSEHKIRPTIDRVLTFSDCNDALGLMKRSSQFGKLVLSDS